MNTRAEFSEKVGFLGVPLLQTHTRTEDRLALTPPPYTQEILSPWEASPPTPIFFRVTFSPKKSRKLHFGAEWRRALHWSHVFFISRVSYLAGRGRWGGVLFCSFPPLDSLLFSSKQARHNSSRLQAPGRLPYHIMPQHGVVLYFLFLPGWGGGVRGSQRRPWKDLVQYLFIDMLVWPNGALHAAAR